MEQRALPTRRRPLDAQPVQGRLECLPEAQPGGMNAPFFVIVNPVTSIR